eukprot:6984046-Heterocapsa_arctica.AAC.1
MFSMLSPNTFEPAMLHGVVKTFHQNFARTVHAFPPGHKLFRSPFFPRGLFIATNTSSEHQEQDQQT